MNQGMRMGVLVVSAVLALVGSAGAAESIREGKWEFASEMQMEGMVQMPALPPGVTLPPGMAVSTKGNTMHSTMVKCITKDDLLPGSDRKSENTCKTTKMERKGNTLHWSTVCTEGGMKMTGNGVATYSGEVMDSTMTMTTQGQGQSMRQTVKTKGKYLGVCSK
ncbi:DUF3617 domain-containing protein [Thiovibrio frasassiensis]|uniref:DUF3617 domain-containing protein n=1 Tax=Thiovibrio frasassiensis TaxID=2984131 RepID=A0A9X4MBX4_9BACT|nr:DUF3617 family protein [Thiovibrio frasassiensis]MDG4474764.1 DUF3617 domain-containing protein [Thiovibrio frasassiensis]